MGFSSCPVLTPMPLGTGGGEEKKGKHGHTLQLRFQGEEAEEDDFSSFLSSPERQMWGRSLLWCWREAELLLRRSQHLCSVRLIVPLGKFSNFNTVYGFFRGHNLPVSHSAHSPSALLKESWHFQRSQRSSLAWLDIYTCIFYQEIGEWHSVLINLKTVESFFPLESFRAHFLTVIHDLKMILSFHQFISKNTL